LSGLGPVWERGAEARRPLHSAAGSRGWLALPLAASLTLLAARAPVRPCSLAVLVADARTGIPLSDARVEIAAFKQIQRTDSSGELCFTGLAVGIIRVTAARVGYAPMESTVSLTAADSSVIVFLMRRSTPALDTVRVKGYQYAPYLQEFETRRRSGLGRYLTYPQLDSAWWEPIADLAARRFPGLRAEWDQSNTSVGLKSTRGAATFGGRTCGVQVYVDGFSRKGEDLAFLRAGDLAAVEYYATAPPVQYPSAGFACGVLLIWTRWY